MCCSLCECVCVEEPNWCQVLPLVTYIEHIMFFLIFSFFVALILMKEILNCNEESWFRVIILAPAGSLVLCSYVCLFSFPCILARSFCHYMATSVPSCHVTVLIYKYLQFTLLSTQFNKQRNLSRLFGLVMIISMNICDNDLEQSKKFFISPSSHQFLHFPPLLLFLIRALTWAPYF